MSVSNLYVTVLSGTALCHSLVSVDGIPINGLVQKTITAVGETRHIFGKDIRLLFACLLLLSERLAKAVIVEEGYHE